MTHFQDVIRKQRFSRRAVLASGTAMAAALRLSRVAGETPESSGAFDGRQRLREMLSLVPDAAMPTSGMLFDWFDAAAHFTAGGLAYPLQDIPPADFLMSIVTSDPLMPRANGLEVEDMLGFSVFDVHQILNVGVPPAQVVIYRGGVPFGDLAATWEAGGYEAVSGDFGDFWTRGQDGEIDFQDTLQRKVLARMNNIALLDETTLACAPTAALLGTFVRHATEGGSTAAASPDIEPLLDRLPEGIANAAGFGGDIFDMGGVFAGQALGGPEALRAMEDAVSESDAAVGPMPRIQSAIGSVSAGARSGGSADQSAYLAILPQSKDHVRELAEVVFWRYEHMESVVTGEPYTDILTIVTTPETVVDGPIAIVEASAADAGRGVWYRMIMQGDILMFGW